MLTTDEFMRSVFEIAFGADAADRDFTREEVLQKLRVKAIEWTSDDVREHKPDWSLIECQDWLEVHEEKLRERTSELGSKALKDMLDSW